MPINRDKLFQGIYEYHGNMGTSTQILIYAGIEDPTEEMEQLICEADRAITEIWSDEDSNEDSADEAVYEYVDRIIALTDRT
jgi:hypothetical protein